MDEPERARGRVGRRMRLARHARETQGEARLLQAAPQIHDLLIGPAEAEIAIESRLLAQALPQPRCQRRVRAAARQEEDQFVPVPDVEHRQMRRAQHPRQAPLNVLPLLRGRGWQVGDLEHEHLLLLLEPLVVEQ